MKRLISLAVCLVVLLTALVSSQPAEAATAYRWNNTGVTLGTLSVRFANGDQQTLRAIDSTSRDVYAFRAVYARRYTIYVAETGTTLFNFTHCSDNRWITFNSQTDSKRHVVARVSNSHC